MAEAQLFQVVLESEANSLWQLTTVFAASEKAAENVQWLGHRVVAVHQPGPSTELGPYPARG